MTESIPIYLYLNDKSNSDLGFWVLEDSDIPSNPKVIDSLLHIRGKSGRYDFQPDLDSREFKFKCGVKAQSSSAALQTVLRNLNALLVAANGTPRTVKLILAMEPDLYYNVRVDGEINPSRFIYHTAGEFSLNLVAHDPFAYGAYHVIEETVEDNYSVVSVIEEDALGTIESKPRIVIKNLGSETIDWLRLEILQKEAGS